MYRANVHTKKLEHTALEADVYQKVNHEQVAAAAGRFVFFTTAEAKVARGWCDFWRAGQGCDHDRW